MKEKFEEIEMEIVMMSETDIITTSSVTPEIQVFAHDNRYFSWNIFE